MPDTRPTLESPQAVELYALKVVVISLMEQHPKRAELLASIRHNGQLMLDSVLDSPHEDHQIAALRDVLNLYMLNLDPLYIPLE